MKLDYGPLRTLFESEDISEIMINAWNKVFVEHKGLIVETSAKFVDQRQFDEFIYTILTLDKKKIDSAFSFDGILPNGERYNITLPPLSAKGPTLTIRKFLAQNFSLDDLVKRQFLSDKAAVFLKAAVVNRLSLVISGGTGSGKTSFLNTLSSEISPTERIVSIEDVAELRFQHPNWISLQSVNTEKLKLSTKDCLSRIESLVQIGGIEMPVKQLRFLMSKSLNIVIQIRRRSDGQREIVDITEVIGMDHETITRAIIFEKDGLGNLVTTGLIPNALKKINASGVVLPHNFFEPRGAPRKVS